MDNEPLEERDQENSDYDTTDPEVPVVRHPPTISADHPLHTRAHHVETVVSWMRVGGLYVWRNVLWNRAFWNFASTVAIAIATVLYTHYARKQLKAINDQFPELHVSAEAAKSAAKTAERTLGNGATEFRIEERPYSVVQNVEFDSRLEANKEMRLLIIVDNSGQTPALKLSFVEAKFHIGKDLVGNQATSDEEYVVSSHHPIKKGYKIEFSNKDLDRLTAGEKALIFKVEGTIRYTDVFENWHETSYCSFYDVKGSAFKFCPHGNDVH